MNWAVNISETAVDNTKFAFYRLYLNSLVNRYSVFVPTDEFFNSYIDPIAFGQTVPAALKFRWDEKTSSVRGSLWRYDKTTNTVGDSLLVAEISSANTTGAAFLKNRLWDLLDSHIILGDITPDKQYYLTKANDIIKVTGSGGSLSVQGGQDVLNGVSSKVELTYGQENGATYFVDKPIQPALRSVYKVLGESHEFEEFYKLLVGVPDTCVQQIIVQQGIDFRIKFFNAYRYTLYVPTNEAVLKAIADGKIKTWEEIYEDTLTQAAQINRMIRILKYHFQDDVVFVGNNIDKLYQSATIKDNDAATHFQSAKNKYLKIGVQGDGSKLTLTMDTPNGSSFAGQTATTTTTNNIIAKDYIFGRLLGDYKNADNSGTASATAFSSSTISTSASAVIHQIDNFLTFE
jgi:uncharacterized surface protein with fasciclin (FAS1) repeats